MAKRTPHRKTAIIKHKVADGISINEAAFAEPFAVVLHAVNRAGSLLGKRVLVTGCGPIGALAIMAARLHGAREIVATDVVAAVLEKALQLGADWTINVADDPDHRPKRCKRGVAHTLCGDCPRR